jgi:hypothetical protein
MDGSRSTHGRDEKSIVLLDFITLIIFHGSSHYAILFILLLLPPS